MFQRILVPLDGSDGAERAIPVAARIARASGGSIVFIRVVPPPAEVGTFGTGLHGTIAMKPEVEASEKEFADATNYLVTVITGYVDELAESALEPAARLIAALTAPAQGELHLLRVVDMPSAYGKMKSQAYISDGVQEEARKEAEAYVKAVADRLRETTFATGKLNVTSSAAVSTDVAGTIIKLAEQTEGAESSSCDLIAIATHGRGGLRRMVMGSVTEHLLGSTRLPLLIVRPHEAETKDEEPGEAVTEVETQTWPGLL